ncbi:hypothetical protein NDR87_31980 [Nocardia sp. CDC159]|uniref:Uncharacterized protein n=1 Tax=Nocardia pulmonis TaxID=2951408 RepID=A0A9X2EH11_9NOCA|nr:MULTISPECIES: hypothetical protein [Nocardia]MCM6778111.1 hypothetical protein [Nocardia pulmonis]MCM6791000.1 hypothetical protein [Nocardia sp. CDC159]
MFGNDPTVVAGTFRRLLDGQFDEVGFAILDRAPGAVRATFESLFARSDCARTVKRCGCSA